MQTILIRSDGDVARVVALTAQMAKKARFDTVQAAAVSTAASELARNIVKYAGVGQVSVREVAESGATGVRVVATDRGPGIADVGSALRDHYSTGGTLGLGLPGVKRLMDEIEIDSKPGEGTTVTATLWNRGQRETRRPPVQSPTPFRLRHGATVKLSGNPDGPGFVEAAARIRPHHTERVSGDVATLRWIGDRVVVALVDALGHGTGAAAIAKIAESALSSSRKTDIPTIMGTLDEALRATDGAAVAVAVVDPVRRTYETAAVGNVRVRIVGGSDRRLEWSAGTVGTHYRTPTVTGDKLGDSTLLLYSDGIADHFELPDYPGIRSDRPEGASRIIVDRFGKDHDDASCVVLRCTP
jgi:anti-sigma regulatory factor (Ser/Thr protein kinase)